MTSYQRDKLKKKKEAITRFMMMYKFALNKMETKVDILQEEFQLLHDYNPIEHTSARLKSPKSILTKIYRKENDISFTSIKKNIQDIAGQRITCAFISDIYRICDMLTQQKDLTLLEVKDYIKCPKPNGYRSLHVLIEVPVFMTDSEEKVPVEIQIRTIAMDFWASLEHKIYYKYDASVPSYLLKELKKAADTANALDKKMEGIHSEVAAIKKEQTEESEEITKLDLNNQQFPIPAALLELMNADNE